MIAPLTGLQSQKVGWQLALPMYNNSPELTDAACTLLRRVTQGLQAQGWAAPMTLSEPDPQRLTEFWRAPNTLLSQTCGYPLVTQLAHEVTVLARPHFNIDGCDGPQSHRYCSFVVVRAAAAAQTLADLQGLRLAANSPDSHSGMNALRHLLAPVAAPRLVQGRFFSALIWSGGHAHSLALVQNQQADVCAVDCVTFANLVKHRPETIQGLRVLARTAQAPCLPWVCNQHLSAEQKSQLLSVVLDLPNTESAACTALRLHSFKPATLGDYQPITAMQEEAVRGGYGVLG